MKRSRTLEKHSQIRTIIVPKSAAQYASLSRSAGTKLAYGSALKSFASWCVNQRYASLPAQPRILAEYLASLASAGKRLSTIRKAKAAIDAAHRLSGCAVPGKEPLVQEVLQGIAREIGSQPQQKKPLVTADIKLLLRHIPGDLKGTRDRALLLLGFAGAMRRSELVTLDVADLEFVQSGIHVRIRKSKTDQEGRSSVIGIPMGSVNTTCPVHHVREWLAAAGIERGPVFRAVTRHGHVGDKALSGKAVAMVVQLYVELAGLDPDSFGGHSLRAGFITAAAMAGVEERDIARQSRHKNVAVLRGYVREATVFQRNAAGQVGL